MIIVNEDTIGKKKYRQLAILAVSLFVLGFAAILVAAALQSAGVANAIVYPLGFSSFPLLLASVVVILRNMKGMLGYELKARYDRLERTGSAAVAVPSSPDAMRDRFLFHRFAASGSVLRRTYTSSVDYVNYFAIIRGSADPVGVLKEVVGRFATIARDANGRRLRRVVLYVVCFTDAPSAADAEAYRTFAMDQILMQAAARGFARGAADAIIPILYDGTKQSFVFLDQQKRMSQQTYDIGVRWFKRHILG